MGAKLLASDACKKIIGLSKCANRILNYTSEQFGGLRDAIREKMCVVHPPQDLYVESYDQKELNGSFITFCFVGSDFFRKGGKEMLIAFDRLLKMGAPIKLNIISKMESDDEFIIPTKDEIDDALRIIERYPNNIKRYKYLHNSNVVTMLKNSHVALLPTLHDTYGYSVLEAQACACPVITTNIRALPEINNDTVGWLIDVPTDELGLEKIYTIEDREICSNLVQEGLFEIIGSIVNDPKAVVIKGKQCISRIDSDHNPVGVAEKLESIYDQALCH